MTEDVLELIKRLSETPTAWINIRTIVRPQTKIIFKFEDRFNSTITLAYHQGGVILTPTAVSSKYTIGTPRITLIYQGTYSMEFYGSISAPLLTRTFLDFLANDPTPSEIAHSEIIQDMQSENDRFSFSYTGSAFQNAFLQDRILLEAGTILFQEEYEVDSIKDPDSYYCRVLTDPTPNYNYIERCEAHRYHVPAGSQVFYKNSSGVMRVGVIAGKEYSRSMGDQYKISNSADELISPLFIIAILKWNGDDVS